MLSNCVSLTMDFERQIKKRRSSCDDEHHQPVATNFIHSIPQEIMANIISRLPITSLVQFRFVCKSWNQLSRDPHLVNLHDADPCLIFHTDYPLRNQLCFVHLSCHDIDYEKVRRINIPFAASMPEFSVVGSCNGLLCLSDSLLNHSTLYIYNPFTRDYKELPKFIEFEQQQMVIGFGFHPVTKEYKVIRIVRYTNTYNQRRIRILRRYNRSDVQVFSLASNKWRSIGESPYPIAPNSSSVVLNGRWHCLSRIGRYHGCLRRDIMVLSFDLADEQFREVQKPEFGPYPSQFYSYHLVVLRDCLGVAFSTPPSYSGNLEIWAMKVYDVKESWVKEYTIASFSPPLRSFGHDDLRPYAIWKNVRFGRAFTILCVLKNGEILIEHKNGSIVSYNPETGVFKNLTFLGLPKLFKTIVHVGGLNWIGT